MTTESTTFVIAEAGVNHNGSLDLALQLIDSAAKAGADAVKFQTFKASSLVAKHASKAAYQKRATDPEESQLDMIRKLELGEQEHEHLIAHCHNRGIAFMSTPFDSESLALLTGRFGLEIIKVSSGDITNAPFLLEIARSARQVILSTGMSTLSEVEAALGVLAFGFTAPADTAPSLTAFEEAYASKLGQAALQQRVSVLHCTTEYPAPALEVNLRAMDTMAQAFGLRTGYSDHTKGIHIPIAAVARGATIIEKHFTLDRNLPGPDHRASLEPSELCDMINAIREVETCLGDGIKRPTLSEWGNRPIARKSLVAARSTQRSQLLDLSCKRPGNGCSPYRYWELQGTPATRDYITDELIDG
ncbi:MULTISPECIES: N-acetylneuraminate synthase [Chromobacterium]|uniref:N-acetylneuraminate synthase n=1 Tax=Chromobacterium rhizoryzae TaxID=1778675 RepID=A0AAD0WAU6_9NEIS|nr:MULTISPECIES: N-acetylneuraminate synthase [Chromobacterium]AXT48972.1 N-acetylneuraminate synthase [Chromobacterium rhizoryzae]PTU72293.1 N-acetylneuraminate synthase [Chromobacterium haemolyticum]QOD82920.1 N-acetylneuraminate synthase [Chromobacterium haemolyticum]